MLSEKKQQKKPQNIMLGVQTKECKGQQKTVNVSVTRPPSAQVSLSYLSHFKGWPNTKATGN